VCGIVGLHVRDAELELSLGALLANMLVTMTDRGPDSTGVAIYSGPNPDGTGTKYSCRADDRRIDWPAFAARNGLDHRIEASGAVLVGDRGLRDTIELDGVQVISEGVAVEVFKMVGPPQALIDRIGLTTREGYQAVGHTRMATESAVTTDGSHPFSTHPDLCLVHNGSFSNYFTVRRDLEADGERFVSENDTEVAARLIGQELAQGHSLRDALDVLRSRLDGFYTLLCTTRDEFAVVRDAVGCKPAIVAVHDRYVAMASEYRAFADLPDVARAQIYEPAPSTTHVWSRR
jgi:glutamate synthase domain-containing protein 1